MRKKLLAGLMSASLAIGSLLFTPTASAEVRTYEGIGEYELGDFDQPDIAMKKAKERAIRNAQEQMAIFVRSYSKVENYVLKEDVVEVISSTVLNLADEKYDRIVVDGRFAIRAVVHADIDSDEIDRYLARDIEERETLVSQLKALRKAQAEYEELIADLRRQLNEAKSVQAKEALAPKFAEADKIFLSNQKLEEGNKYLYAGKYSEAIQKYNEALELNPRYASAYNNRGSAYQDIKQYEQAIADYTKAIELEPNDAVRYNNRGKAYKALGDTARAEADFSKARELGYTE